MKREDYDKEQIVWRREYHSPPGRKQNFFRRLYFPVSICFYVQIIQIIYESWQMVKKGAFDNFCWSKQSRKIIEAVESNGGIVHIQGLNHIRNTGGPVVFVSNHMSTLETFILPCLILPKDFTFIIKESLLNYPCMGGILRSLKAIAVTRENPREDLKSVLYKGMETLKSGRSLLIFPQSTRTLQIDPAQFNTMGIKLAARGNVPIIPIAVKTDFWGNGKLIRDFGPIGKSREVYITFGKPMMIKGKGREEHKKIIHFIISHLRQWAKPVR